MSENVSGSGVSQRDELRKEKACINITQDQENFNK